MRPNVGFTFFPLKRTLNMLFLTSMGSFLHTIVNYQCIWNLEISEKENRFIWQPELPSVGTSMFVWATTIVVASCVLKVHNCHLFSKIMTFQLQIYLLFELFQFV